MKFIELTKSDGSKILVNINGIMSINAESTGAALFIDGANLMHVTESYDYIKNLIYKPSRALCE